MPDREHPGVGLGVIIVHERRMLAAERKCGAGKGLMAVCGGHMEVGDPSVAYRAATEAREETGLEVAVLPVGGHDAFLTTYHRFDGDPKPFVHLWVACVPLQDVVAFPPENREPDKHAPWQWLTLDSLVAQPRLQTAVAAWQSGRHHPQLDWLPLADLFRLRHLIGL